MDSNQTRTSSRYTDEAPQLGTISIGSFYSLNNILVMPIGFLDESNILLLSFQSENLPIRVRNSKESFLQFAKPVSVTIDWK